jgi:glycosyltransferase involved in cell wall biosynthesis
MALNFLTYEILMNIVFLISGLKMGGAEVQVCALASEIFKRGHNVSIVSLMDGVVVTPDFPDIKVITLGLEGVSSLPGAFSRFRRFVKEFSPDIVHSHLFHANIFSRLFKLFYGLPFLVCTAHNTYDGGLGRVVLYRATDSINDVFTNVSQEAVDSFVDKKATTADRIRVVYNGIDTEKFKFDESTSCALRSEFNIPKDAKLILAVGRLHTQKNFSLLLDAISSISTSQVVLVIVGAGPLLAELRNKALNLGIQDKVVFAGVRTDVPKLMGAADLFVLSSSWEGFGLVVAEAMASEVLTVATDCGGVKEVLGDCGYLIPPDDMSALSGAISQALLISEEKRESLTRNGRKRVVNLFSIENAVNNWLSIYNERK